MHFIAEAAVRQREAAINQSPGKPIIYLRMGLPISRKALRGVDYALAYTRIMEPVVVDTLGYLQ